MMGAAITDHEMPDGLPRRRPDALDLNDVSVMRTKIHGDRRAYPGCIERWAKWRGFIATTQANGCPFFHRELPTIFSGASQDGLHVVRLWDLPHVLGHVRAPVWLCG